ncbi:ORF27 [Human gammaherpesvirus 8]|uniref:ORF27 n=1 Tax=Human herpesvirus 8 TaxID=37296 RepID=A0A0N9RPQ3_HHV8|nr:ORF27 [Human gammaherpesvirus 8]ALH45233.1 ORF27 [Human gammaherpesvirus 8]QKE51462.1 ORF27 [Human gammaherpesvirus 8]QLF97196.1 ORF27 [Human gammaherpesvirus 8]QLI55126.1 ORF27 [Human gammaherpesvirus 8]
MASSDILSVARTDDGSVCEVSLRGGRKKTTVYLPDTEPWVVETDAIKDAFLSDGIVDMARKFHRGALPSNSHNGLRMVLFCYCYLQNCVYLALFLCPLNPYLVTPSSIEFAEPVVAPEVLFPHPAEMSRGCDDAIFCKLPYTVPIINTTFGRIYPNSTREPDGRPTDYSMALRRAFAVMVNTSCAGVTLCRGETQTASRNHTEWENLLAMFSVIIYALDHNCHPEALSIASGIFDERDYGLFISQPRSVPSPTPCDVSWEDIYNGTYLARPGNCDPWPNLSTPPLILNFK